MKKQTISCLKVLSVISLFAYNFFLFSSCKREGVTITQPELTIEKAKNWFKQNYPGNITSYDNTGQNQQGSEFSTVHQSSKTSKIGKFIMWDSHQSLFVDGTHYLAIDISNGSIKFTNGQYGARLVLFSINSTSQMKMNIIEILSKNPATKTNALQLLENIIRTKKGLSTTHKIEQTLNAIVYSEDYKYAESFSTKNGVFESKNIKIIKRNVNSTNPVATEPSNPDFSSSENGCTLWGYFEVTYDQWGNILEQELLYTYLVCPEGNPNEEDMPGEYGGGDSTELLNFQENNNLTDPCLQAAKAAITNSTLTNYIYGLYSSAYLSPGNFNISWNQNSVMSGFGRSFPSTAAPNTWIIELNNSMFASNNSSKQYIASVMLHEIIHTLLIQNNITGVTSNDWLDHSTMFFYWTNYMRDALMESFGMDMQSATALALGGINDVLSYSYAPNSTSWRDFMNNFAVSNYGISLNNAELIQFMHMTGGQGTPCN